MDVIEVAEGVIGEVEATERIVLKRARQGVKYVCIVEMHSFFLLSQVN